MGEQKMFIRHPDEFPIELDLQESHQAISDTSQLQLVCHSEKPFHSGETIAIKIPSIASQLEVSGTMLGIFMAIVSPEWKGFSEWQTNWS